MPADSNVTTPAARGQGHAVLRVERDSNFRTINLSATHDDRLSWRAKGLHTYLVSRPDGWEFNVSDLRNRAKDGRDAVYAGLRELEEFGYLRRVQPKGEGQPFGPMEWTIRETGSASWDSGSGNPVSGSSVSGEPDTNIDRVKEEGVEVGEEKNTAPARTRESPEAQAIRDVFEDWQSHTDRPRHKLTDPHKAKIRARLREGFTAAHLKLATRGAWASPWMRGQNDRETDYTYPRTIFRDADCVERHIRNARRALPPEPWWPEDGQPGASPVRPIHAPEDDLRIRASDVHRMFRSA